MPSRTSERSFFNGWTFNRHRRGNGRVPDFEVFAGRNHFAVDQPTRREDADVTVDWLGRD